MTTIITTTIVTIITTTNLTKNSVLAETVLQAKENVMKPLKI
jgi:hypothetical protein